MLRDQCIRFLALRGVALRRGVAGREALCRVRTEWVRVRWGAFCVPGGWLCYTVALLRLGTV